MRGGSGEWARGVPWNCVERSWLMESFRVVVVVDMAGLVRGGDGGARLRWGVR